jgi:LL-H family phage holin
MEDFILTLLASPEFATFFVGTLAAVVGGVIAFVGKELRALLNRKLTTEQLALLMKIAREAVRVAEQTGVAATGEEKKDEAIKVAATFLAAYGIKVSESQLDAAIEAAVFAELNQWKDLPELPDTATGVADDLGEAAPALEG